MLARRDTRYEAARVRRLSPLETVEDQSQAWGLCCHSCTWREGFAPSWQTELQGSYLPCGLPGSLGFLSTNGSHFDHRGGEVVRRSVMHPDEPLLGGFAHRDDGERFLDVPCNTEILWEAQGLRVKGVRAGHHRCGRPVRSDGG